jgi:glycerophosphoryl diester phosphodiesterase
MARPLVIAHRGASGYLPEHTLAAKALAFAMGADYLEQDVVAARDGELVVLHDLVLDHTTDVASRYPGRQRADGHFYCIDFALEELRTLNVGERRASAGAGTRYPDRFPEGAGRFGIVTLDEEIEFVQGLARSTGRTVGIYPEIKEPDWHRSEGVDLGARLVETLERFGYQRPEDPVFVQCFYPAELQRLRSGLGCRLRLVQLLDSDRGVPSAAELASVAGYADAIGPSIGLVCQGHGAAQPTLTSLVADARATGLAVHPYTFRKDDLPGGIRDFTELLTLFVDRLGVDGLFTDFPDLVVDFLDARTAGPQVLS